MSVFNFCRRTITIEHALAGAGTIYDPNCRKHENSRLLFGPLIAIYMIAMAPFGGARHPGRKNTGGYASDGYLVIKWSSAYGRCSTASARAVPSAFHVNDGSHLQALRLAYYLSVHGRVNDGSGHDQIGIALANGADHYSLHGHESAATVLIPIIVSLSLVA